MTLALFVGRQFVQLESYRKLLDFKIVTFILDVDIYSMNYVCVVGSNKTLAVLFVEKLCP
jgi:hypothetical protein